ncbi:MAG: hypothetical protein KA354_20270, partial [Phycisphaerae bacterium]|nr:hypothetical protein [Phycisphaerae bacterium]
ALRFANLTAGELREQRPPGTIRPAGPCNSAPSCWLLCNWGVYYMAIEPYARRFWPHSLISWTRVLTGRLGDPLVGRDILIGCAFGVTIFVLQQLSALAALHTPRPWSAMVGPILDWELGQLSGYQFMASSLVNAGLHAITRSLIILALMLILRLVFRQRWLAVSGLFLLLTAACVLALDPASLPALITCALLGAGAACALDGPGFLAFVISLFVTRLLVLAPLTLDRHAWYASQSLLSVLIVVGLVAWSLKTSLTRSSGARRPSSAA